LLSTKKLHRLLGDVTLTPLEEGLRVAIHWMMNQGLGEKQSQLQGHD